MDTTVRTNAHTTAIATKNSYGTPLAINTAPHRDPIDKDMATVQAVMRFVQWFCVDGRFEGRGLSSKETTGYRGGRYSS